MDARQSWQCQGRQYHGWFGDGTCADSGLPHDRHAGAAETAKAQHILAVLYGAVGALPAQQRRRWEGWLQRGGAARLSRVLRAWSAARLDDAAIQARFMPEVMGARVNAAAHELAKTVAAGAAGASAKLAELVLAVDLDGWPRFVAEAEEKLAPRPTAPDRRDVQLAGNYTDPGAACRALGMNANEFSRNLHALKGAAGLGGADNVMIHVPSGDVFFNGECIGNVHDG